MPPDSALYRTIHAQPTLLADLLDTSESWSAAAAALLLDARRVYISGTGSSSHAAVVGEHLLRLAGLDAYATTHFDFVAYPRPLHSGDVLIAISHTGRTRYGQQAIARAAATGAPIIGITGAGSEMRGTTLAIATAPREQSDTYTASYTTSLLALGLLASAAGAQAGRDVMALRMALSDLPTALHELLAVEAAIVPVAEGLAARGRLTLVGAGPNAATAREGALKVKESSYLVAEGGELETTLHGVLQAVERGDMVAAIAADGPAVPRTGDLLRALETIGAEVLVIADTRIADRLPCASATLVTYPSVPEALSPLLAVIPLQLLAAWTAHFRGTNPDNFRFSEAAYKQAIEGLTL